MFSVVTSFIQIFVALPVFLLWLMVVALLGRAFGIVLPFRLLGRNGASQSLTLSQYLWVWGVLCWGCGMWIVTTLDDYLDWKYWGGSAYRLSAAILLIHAVLWSLAGLLFGWMTWKTKNA